MVIICKMVGRKYLNPIIVLVCLFVIIGAAIYYYIIGHHQPEGCNEPYWEESNFINNSCKSDILFFKEECDMTYLFNYSIDEFSCDSVSLEEYISGVLSFCREENLENGVINIDRHEMLTGSLDNDFNASFISSFSGTYESVELVDSFGYNSCFRVGKIKLND